MPLQFLSLGLQLGLDRGNLGRLSGCSLHHIGLKGDLLLHQRVHLGLKVLDTIHSVISFHAARLMWQAGKDIFLDLCFDLL